MERGRYSRSELAGLIGSAPKTLAAWSHLPSFPEPDARDRFDGLEFLAWWLEKKATKSFRQDIAKRLGLAAIAMEEPAPAVDEDFQHRRQRAKALIEELRLEEQQGSVVRVADVMVHLETLTKSLRTGAEVLQRRFGPEAADILETALKEAETELGRLG